MVLSSINSSLSFSLNVSWAPLADLTHGVFQFYGFIFSDARTKHEWNVTVPTGRHYHVFNGFKPFKLYGVRARPVTLEGPGKWSEKIYVLTDESGKIRVSVTKGRGTVSGRVNIYICVDNGFK